MNKWQCKTGEGVARKLAAAAPLKQIRIVCHWIISHPFALRRSVFRHLLLLYSWPRIALLAGFG